MNLFADIEDAVIDLPKTCLAVCLYVYCLVL